MTKRKIIEIDEDKCTGCGLCIPNCPEGAIQIIDGKARLISDLFCDGLGACLGHCPEGAIQVIEREAAPYSETKVMANIVRQGPNTIRAHLKHLKEHGEESYLKEALAYLEAKKVKVPVEEPLGVSHPHGFSGCPGSRVIDMSKKTPASSGAHASGPSESELRQWPVQLSLVPPHAPYLKRANLLIAADCVPFAYPDFHSDFLKDKVVLVGCPKLDDVGAYQEKLEAIFKDNDIEKVTYVHMEVPCCFGLIGAIETAIAGSGKKIPFEEVTIAITGEVKQ